MPSFFGTKELGLKTEWRYGFVDPGLRLESTPGSLCIDVGGAVKPGIIDFNADPAQGNSCAEIVLHRRDLVYNHLLSDWIRRHEEGKITSGTKWTPILITHYDPGWDALVAAFLAIRLIEKGEFPVYAEALVQYVRCVNQGCYRLDATRPHTAVAPHMAFKAIQNLRGPDGRPLSPEAQFVRGLEMLDRILSHIQMERSEAKVGLIRKAEDFLPGSPGGTVWIKDPWFVEIKKLLDTEPARFQRDSGLATRLEDVALPAVDGSDPLPVRAFIAPAPMESIFNEHWVQSSGYSYLICPFGNPRSNANAASDSDPIYPRVSLSIDPNFEVNGRRPNLRGLGYILEKMETECRKARNQGMDDRGNVPKFADSYCANDDPWDDGREADFTIVDSPRSGTWIPYSKIVEVATKQSFWEVPLQNAFMALLWVDRGAKRGKENRTPIEPSPGINRVLQTFYRDSAEEAAPAASDNHSLPEGISISGAIRYFPEGTCAPMVIEKVHADSRATLESFITARSRIIQQRGGVPPDYVFAKVAVAKHFSNPARIDHLLSRLGNGETSSLGESSGAGEQLLLNSRTVIVRDDRGQDKVTERAAEVELELLIYSAFLSESLDEFAGRIGKSVPGAGRSQDLAEAKSLLHDFLRFRAHYYRFDVDNSARGGLLFHRLASSLRLADRYADAQSLLDRIGKAPQAGGSRAQVILLIIAVTLVLQASLIFHGLSKESLRDPILWVLTVVVLAVGAISYLRIARHR